MYSFSFTDFVNKSELKIFCCNQESNPGLLLLTRKRSTTELRQPSSKQTLQFCINTVLKGTAMLQSHSQKTFFKDSF